MHPLTQRRSDEVAVFEALESFYNENYEGNRNSPFLFVERQSLCASLSRYEMYKKIKEKHGAIVECGVHKGNNFMFFNHLVSIFEPYNLTREVIGFDTFDGFRSLSEKDNEALTTEGFSDARLDLLERSLELHDRNRALSHIQRGTLVKGDACETIPKYVDENPHLVISLLYLDFDIYEPTKTALQHLLPLVHKGGIVAFDELAMKKWSGETVAFKEFLSVSGVELERFYFESQACYFVVK